MPVRATAGISAAPTPRAPRAVRRLEALPKRPEQDEGEPHERDREQNHAFSVALDHGRLAERLAPWDIPRVRRHLGAALGLLALIPWTAAATVGVGSATDEAAARRAHLDPTSLLRQGELDRFFVLRHVYTYRSPERWANSPDVSLSGSAAARLREEGFRVALSKHLRAWHDAGTVHPFKPGWYGTTSAVEVASQEAAAAEMRAMIRDDKLALEQTQADRYRPFAMPGVPGARGYCAGAECRVIFTVGREVHLLTVGWAAGPGARTAGRQFLDSMRVAAARQFARLRKLS
jgi:hypothetical protein